MRKIVSFGIGCVLGMAIFSFSHSPGEVVEAKPIIVEPIIIDEPQEYVPFYTDLPLGSVDAELDLFARCVEAEAGNQGELGKRYVADVILNRAEQWGQSVEEVILTDCAFSVVSNGSIDRVTVSEETLTAIEKELKNRTNSEILYFRTGHYHSWAVDCFRWKDHYFSK